MVRRNLVLKKDQRPDRRRETVRLLVFVFSLMTIGTRILREQLYDKKEEIMELKKQECNKVL